MNIIVSKDIVKLNENHSENHYGEYNVNECVFEFDEYFDSVPIKKAIFTSQSNNKSFEIDIINNKCTVPHEVLTKVYDTVILGVYGYDVNEETLLVRYSPEPTTFVVHEGSYREGAEQPEIITPTQYDMFSKALQEGLAEVDGRLDDVEKQGDYAKEQGDYAKSVGEQLEKDKENGLFKGDKGDKGEQGIQGEKGEQGEPGKDGENGKDGYTPIKGKDYFDGQDGKDYVLTEADKEEIADNINEENNNRFTENEKYISELEATIDILTNTNTAKGELVHITDALSLPTFENKVSGNVKQETTTGKNLLNLNTTPIYVSGASSTFNEPNITITKTSPSLNASCVFIVGDANILNGKTLKYTGELLSGTSRAIIGYADADGGNRVTIAGNTNINSGTFERTITVDGTTYANKKVVVWLYSDVLTTGNIGDKIIYKNVMVSENGGDYEPYTGGQASPNPEYPQEIEVLEAYNLLDNEIETQTINGLTVTKNKDKSVTINGTANATFNVYWKNTSFVLEKGSYKIGLISPMTTGINLYLRKKVGDNVILMQPANKSYSDLTIDEDTEYTTLASYINEGTVFNNVTFYPIIIKGDKEKPYVPYGCVGFKVIGANLFTNTLNWVSKNISGNNRFGYELQSLSDITYYSRIDTNEGAFRICKEENGVVSLIGVGISSTINSVETLKGAKYYLMDVSTSNETNAKTHFQNAKLMISSISTPYEPYQEQIVPLDLKGNWVGKVSDTIKDYLVTDKKKLWLVKNVNRGLISMNNYPYETNIDMWYFFNKPKDSEDYGVYTTNGLCEVAVNSLNKPIRFDGGGNQVQYAIVYKKSQVDKIPTNDEIKELVDGKYFYYKLKEPQIIELGELPEPIKTFEGVNNIQVLANLDTEIEVKYALDVKKYFENKLASIQEQIL